MSLKLGTTTISKAYLGSTEIQKMYLGTTIILDNTVSEEFPQDNAAAVSDDNSIGSFTADGGATVTVDAADFHDGSFSIKVQGNGSSFESAKLILTLENATTYEFKYWAKYDVNGEQGLHLPSGGGWDANYDKAITSSSWAEYTLQGTTNSTTCNTFWRVNASTASTDLAKYDLISITKV